LDDLSAELAWIISQKSLALRGQDFTAYVAQQSSDIKHIDPEAHSGVDLDDLRARSGDTRVTELTVNSAGEIVTVSTTERPNVLDSENIAALEERFHRVVQVTGAIIHTGGDASIHCDFLRRSASAAGNTKVPLADLLSTALPLLWPLSDDEEDALRNLIFAAQTRYEDEADDSPVQGTLFDDIPGID
jgi:hypothetical protein